MSCEGAENKPDRARAAAAECGPPPPFGVWLTADEAAAYVRLVDTRAVSRAIKAGRLRGGSNGRKHLTKREYLDEWIEGGGRVKG